ncbi:hypothetical protein [Aliterella atlantica]|uniref:hypothetical protein n=1 Tax=Aliterella atlantica TaxID=1827278 RepID=UPI0019101D4E|nr:hypothetical protein [Aliterella atlantica]
METNVLNVLAIAAFSLLVIVSGGVIYLTAVGWSDRRRQDAEKRANKPTKRK